MRRIVSILRHYLLYIVLMICVWGGLFANRQFGCERLPAGDSGIADFAGESMVIWEVREPVAQSYDYGELVVFSKRGAPETIQLARVFGKPGDLIELTQTRLTRNGEPIGSEHAKRTALAPLIVPRGTLFLLSDTGARHVLDSARVGPIPLASVRGAPLNVE